MSFVDVFTGSIVDPQEVSYRAIALTASIELVWPSLENIETEVAARIMDVVPSGAGFSITMPPANQTGVGTDALFNNLGADSFTVLDNDGNTLGTLAAGEVKYLYLTSNATPAGNWRIFTFGTGTSSADASMLAGAGLTAIAGELAINLEVDEVASSPVAFGVAGDRGKIWQWLGGDLVATLGPSGTATDGFIFGFRNDGSGTATFTPTGADTINLNAALTVNPGDACFFIADGQTPGNWVTVGMGQQATFAFSYAAIDISAGGTITLNAAEAANKILSLEGTPPSTTTVRIPSVASVFWIYNNQGGTEIVQIRTTAGGSNTIILPIGSRRIIVCNGTQIATFPSTESAAVAFELSTAAAPSIYFLGDPTTGIYSQAAGEVGISASATSVMTFQDARIDSDLPFILIDTTGKIRIGNPAQSPIGLQLQSDLWVRGQTISGGLVISSSTDAQVLAGATASYAVIPAGVLVLAVLIRVTTAVTGATDFDVGDGTDVDKWGAAIAIALGTTTDGEDFTALTPTFYTGATNVVLTANGGAFAGGVVKVTAFYIDFTAIES